MFVLGLGVFLEAVITLAIAATCVDKVTLLRRRADATTIACERRTAAVGAHNVIRERQEVVAIKNKRRTRRPAVRPLRGNKTLRFRILQIRRHIYTVIRTNGRRAKATIHQVVHEALTRPLRPVRHSHEHGHVRQKQQCQHSNKIPAAVRHRSTLDAEFCEATQQTRLDP